MAVEINRNVVTGSLLVVFVLILVGGSWWMNGGYGKVSSTTYQYSKALYSACLKKSDEHLSKVEDMLDGTGHETIPQNELKWLQRIMRHARDGQWETAARKAKRMMEDQVEY